MIGDKTHWIDGLTGSPGCNQYFLSFQILFQMDFPQNVFQEDLLRGELSLPHCLTGEDTSIRLDHFHAKFPQSL